MSRVLAHAHSNWSHDGIFSLEEWVKHARDRSIDVVLLSEHEETGWTREKYALYVKECEAASTSDVKLIPGIEFSQDGFHVLCYGLKELPPRPSSAGQLAEAVQAQGCFLCLAHPGKYGWLHPADIIEAASAVEVWNSKWIYDGGIGPHPSSLKIAKGKRYLVGQDVHKVKHFSSLFLETAGNSIINELANGQFKITHNQSNFIEQELESDRLQQIVQLCRTYMMKVALIGWRVVRGKRPFPRRYDLAKHHVTETA